MKSWYQIQAKSQTKAEISILDEIGFWGIGAEQFIKDVKALGGVKEITLLINSPGGSVFEGYAIYNFLMGHTATVTVRVMGLAASIASVIAMAGNAVEMPENAMLMIHDPTGGCVGTAEDMLSVADALEKIKAGIVSTYRKKTGLEDEKISEMMAAETWITAREAVDMGFADVVTDEVKMAANFNTDLFKGYKNIPGTLIAGISTESGKTKKGDKPMITVEGLKADHPEIVEAIKAEVNTDEIRAEGVAEGAENERARILSVKDQLIPGHEDLVNELMFDGKTSGPEAAVKILAAEKKALAAHVEFLADDAPDRVEDEPTDNDTGGDTEGKDLKAKWDADKALQDEFAGDFEAFKAYTEALESGATT